MRTPGGTRALALPKSGPPVTGAGPDPEMSAHSGAGDDRFGAVSTNWSGEVRVGSTFTAVEGEWTVPAVVASTALEYESSWIGVGGVGISQLIQAGTLSVTEGGTTTYVAWYELLPAAQISLPEIVIPGDEMLVKIEQTSAKRWSIGIEDTTQGWNVTETVTYTAGAANSAEWITERPYITTTGKLQTLADFGSVRFHDMRFTASDPTATHLTAVSMETTGRIIAHPGNVTSTTTTNFTDYYGAPTSPPVTPAPATATTPPATPPATSTTTTPAVIAVTPPSGPTAGGTAVAITGTHFTRGATVRFGQVVATHVIFVDSTELLATSPAHTAGLVGISVVVPDGKRGVAADLFRYLAPKVASVSVHGGPTAGGTAVIVTGSDFVKGSEVRFGTRLATHVTVVSTTRIRATSPVHTAGAVNVTVTIPDGTSSPSPADLFRYQPPRVASVSPRDGPTAGSTTVTIIGTDFVRGAVVRFGTKPATHVTVVSTTRIRATSPAGSGIVNVTVSIPGGSSVVSPADRFEYRAA